MPEDNFWQPLLRMWAVTAAVLGVLYYFLFAHVVTAIPSALWVPNWILFPSACWTISLVLWGFWFKLRSKH